MKYDGLPFLFTLEEEDDGHWIGNAVNAPEISSNFPLVAFKVSSEAFERYMRGEIDLLTLQKGHIGGIVAFDLTDIDKSGNVNMGNVKAVEEKENFYPESDFYCSDHI
mgnify:CR=1 FL=1